MGLDRAILAELKRYASHQENDGYTKSISFLDDNFKNVTTFLRSPGARRNSPAEAGRGRHASAAPPGTQPRWLPLRKGRRDVLKIYQAVTYLGWSLHNPPNLAASSG
jgi:hypothetical protein